MLIVMDMVTVIVLKATTAVRMCDYNYNTKHL